MGSWGTGPFDNDGAADLLTFVERAGSGGWRLVRKALYVEWPQDVIAAAELVAMALGSGTRKDERTLDFAVGNQIAMPWVKKYGRRMPTDLPELALRACALQLRKASRSSREQRSGVNARTVTSLMRRLERGMQRGR